MQEKVLVLHVKKGYEERARHIEQMLHEKGIEFEYVTDGDKPDITAGGCKLNCVSKEKK